MLVNYQEYEKFKLEFLQSHDNDFKIVEHPSQSSVSAYCKEYVCTDGAIFYEIIELDATYNMQVGNTPLGAITTLVSCTMIEGWSTNDSISRVYYEKPKK